MLIPKGELHLLLNTYHNQYLDFIMRYYTIVGEWIPYVICALLLLYKTGWAIFTLLGVTLSGLITQGLKYAINADRPLTWFANNMPNVKLQLVEGVHMSKWFSCPSGHTTSFFAMFFALSILLAYKYNNENTDKPTAKEVHRQQKTKNITAQIIFFILAIFGAYSRIYLSQHFLSDTLAGSIVGIATVAIIYPLLQYINNKPIWNYKILNVVRKQQY